MNPAAAFKTLDDWLPWLETLSPREIVLGLERVVDVLERLDLSRPSLVINVAGTNGKGSCVAMIEALLRQRGMRPGCYTSPHLVRYNERTRIDGESASDEALIAALQTVEAARGDVPLTYFEFGTLATLVAFDRAAVDAWVLEVGMGGRLDAVNAIEPDASLITNVALDHCAWLGNDVESIAREKAGVMRKGKPVVFGAETVPDAIRDNAAATGARLILAGQDYSFGRNDDGTWHWQGRELDFPALQPPALAGDVQLANAAAVLAVFEALGDELPGDAEGISEALAAISLAGRFQVIDDRWILDVAHNPAASTVLRKQLDQCVLAGKLVAVVGMLGDKDVAGFLAPLADLVDTWIVAGIDAARAAPVQVIGGAIANAVDAPCLLVDVIEQALRIADERASADDLILVAGSFYVVGPALEWLAGN